MDCKKEIKFMTYNVWSREDVVLYTRMQAIGRLVREHSPDVIFFQEVTPYILTIFKSSEWSKGYHYYSPSPFELQGDKNYCMMFSKLPYEHYERRRFGSTMPGTGGGYVVAYIDPEPTAMKPIRIATTQLQCPVPPASMHFSERYMQAENLLAKLNGEKNAVFGGDMSWDDKADLPFPLPEGWVDAALYLGQLGWTYDDQWNEKPRELDGYVDYESVKRRSDRFVCNLQDYRLNTIQLVGDEPLGVVYMHPKGFKLSPMPNCHRGLVLTIVPK